MPVGELLRRIDSHELTEWMAFEREYGSLGPSYEREMLRQIQYMQQSQLYAFGSANTEEGKQNPIPEPKILPGPDEFLVPEESEDQDEE